MDLHRLRHTQQRLNQAVRQQFRQRIADAQIQTHAAAGTAFQHMSQLASQTEYLLRVVKYRTAGIAQHQFPALLDEQLAAHGLFENRQLAADSGLGQMQYFAGGTDAAVFGNDPKIVQMLVIDSIHGVITSGFSMK